MQTKWLLVLGLTLGLVFGCSSKEDGWYENSSEIKDWKESDMKMFMDQGMSENEAAEAFAAQHAHWQTDTKGGSLDVRVDYQEGQ